MRELAKLLLEIAPRASREGICARPDRRRIEKALRDITEGVDKLTTGRTRDARAALALDLKAKSLPELARVWRSVMSAEEEQKALGLIKAWLG